MNKFPLILTSSSSSAERRRFFVYTGPMGSEEVIKTHDYLCDSD